MFVRFDFSQVQGKLEAPIQPSGQAELQLLTRSTRARQPFARVVGEGLLCLSCCVSYLSDSRVTASDLTVFGKGAQRTHQRLLVQRQDGINVLVDTAAHQRCSHFWQVPSKQRAFCILGGINNSLRACILESVYFSCILKRSIRLQR